jgi:RNA polymerase sigma factor (sigma-70 family)
VEAAEDLAQETLYEAWRHLHKLHDPEGRAQWLSAIARNVCLRWARQRGQEGARFAPLDTEADRVTPRLGEDLADDVDLERDLERAEFITLLDRALALLPPATRRVLIEKYVHESPLAEVAARVGASEGAVAVTLHRGKSALRRLLSSDLCEEATRYGVTLPGSSGWQETRLWCPNCGQHRLLGWFAAGRTAFDMKCPRCHQEGGFMEPHVTGDWMLNAPKGYGRLLLSLMVWADDYFRRALAMRRAPCVGCGRLTAVRLSLPEDLLQQGHRDSVPAVRAMRHVCIRCAVCHTTVVNSLKGLALYLPEGQQFWRVHRRIHALPEREVDAAGRPAVVTSFESLTSQARLDIVCARDTYEVLHVHGAREA